MIKNVFILSCNISLTFVIILITLNMLSSLQLYSFIKRSTIGKSHRNYAIFSTSPRTLKVSSVKPPASTATDEIHQNEYLFGSSPTRFSEIEKLHPMLVKSLTCMSRTHATSIQNKALTSLLTNNDVVISSETGSGKTLTYLVPLFQKIFETKFDADGNGIESIITDVSVTKAQSTSTNILNTSSSYPYAVILVPNKDLAAQVVTMGKSLSEALYDVSGIQINIESMTRNVGNQKWPYIRNGACPEILVCTPVIISNFVRGPIVTDEQLFRSIRTLVFDEADMLVEGSYLIETEKILEAMKKARKQMIRNNEIKINQRACQYILSAATIPNSGKYSIKNYCKKKFPHAIWIENDHVHRLHPTIVQKFIKVHGMSQDGSIFSEARVHLLVKAIIDQASIKSDIDIKSTDSIDNVDIYSDSLDTNRNHDTNSAPTSANTILDASTVPSNEWSIDDLFADEKNIQENNNMININNKIEITADLYARIPRTMVFANDVANVQILTKSLNMYGLKALEFHKLLLPSMKEMYLQLFKEGSRKAYIILRENKILVCTDSASRGLDLPYVEHVVQAEFATNVVQYLHRIGRSSRAGKRGYATNFYDQTSIDLVNAIIDPKNVQGLNFEPKDVQDDTNDNMIENDKVLNKPTEKVVIMTTNSAATPIVSQAFSRRRGLRQKIKRATQTENDQNNEFITNDTVVEENTDTQFSSSNLNDLGQSNERNSIQTSRPERKPKYQSSMDSDRNRNRVFNNNVSSNKADNSRPVINQRRSMSNEVYDSRDYKSSVATSDNKSEVIVNRRRTMPSPIGQTNNRSSLVTNNKQGNNNTSEYDWENL